MTNNNNLKIKTPLLFAVTLAVGMFIGTKLQKSIQPDNKPKSKITELASLLNKYYVDEVNTDSLLLQIDSNTTKVQDSIENRVIQKVLEKLDPHSNYLPPILLKQTNEEMKGEFAGIGVEYAIYKDTVYANYIVTKGPADNATMQVGDKLLKINDSIVAGNQITSTRLRKLLRGENNTKVNITIERNNTTQVLNLIRGMVAITSIDAAYMLTNTVGYIKLNKFSFNSHTECRTAIKDLKTQGMTGLVFDLRDNGGGALNDAVQIIDEFVAGKELITFTEGAHTKTEKYYTGQEGLFEQGKLYVLIDELSASASEVVAGALQDLDRATIIGRRSFGKGLVQRQFGFADNSAVRLTVSRYYTPSGRCIQKPYTDSRETYEQDLTNRVQHSSLFYADSNKIDKSKTYKTKNGRLVYGGGGIMPDHFVALDTSSKYFTALGKLYEKNCFNTYCLQYSLKNKATLQTYKDAKSFNSNFSLPEKEWNAFMEFCKKDNIVLNNISQIQKTQIQEKIKQFLARQLWRTNGYYQAMNSKDNVIQKVLTLLN
jgi:carboxyl-terminal processing protease